MPRSPFVYIATLRRTGSTILAGALTHLPYAFIFREPRFADGKLGLKPEDIELFRAKDIDLREYLAGPFFIKTNGQRTLTALL